MENCALTKNEADCSKFYANTKKPYFNAFDKSLGGQDLREFVHWQKMRQIAQKSMQTLNILNQHIGIFLECIL